MFHHYTLSKLSDAEIEILKGQLAFAFFIEPDFKIRLVKKYGCDKCSENFKVP